MPEPGSFETGDRGLAPTQRLLRGAQLLERPDKGKTDILIQGEEVVAIGRAGDLSAPLIHDVDGLWAMPGVIDSHVHPIHNETFASTGTASLYGGVTTLLHHLYPEAGESAAAAVDRGTQESRRAPADVGFHLRLTPDRLLDHLPELPLPGVVSAKVFLAHSDSTVMCSLANMYTAARHLAAHRLVMIVHAELGEVLERARLDQRDPEDLAQLDAQRPSSIEAAAVTAVGAVSMMTGVRAYIAHVSSAFALHAARTARGAGAHVMIETCPHYLLLTHDAPLGGLGKVSPPLRSAHDVAALRAAVHSGEVDVVASDHCGYVQAHKLPENIAASWNGLPGIEQLLPLLLDAAITGEWITFPELVKLLCARPAHIFGLQKKGRLEPGYDADLVLLDLGATAEIRHRQLHDRSFFSPYEGRNLRGSIVGVLRRGEMVMEHGAMLSDSPGRVIEIIR